jgi:hypothetical protein
MEETAVLVPGSVFKGSFFSWVLCVRRTFNATTTVYIVHFI